MKLVSSKFNKKDPGGLFGVEVEVEVESLSTMPLLNAWHQTEDGSLRGESAEFVFKRPLDFDSTVKEVCTLYNYLNECGVKDTGRAGIHVHLNVNGLTTVQLINLITLWMIVEETAVKWCGPSRKGNLFCLTNSEAYGNVIALIRSVESNDFRPFLKGDGFRYSALNLCSLWKYGSVEFRCLGTPTEVGPVLEWIRFINKLYEACQKWDNPATLMLAMSAGGYAEFIKQLFDSPVVSGITQKDLREGVNNAQMVAFARDWATFDRTRTIGGLEFDFDNEAIEPMEDI